MNAERSIPIKRKSVAVHCESGYWFISIKTTKTYFIGTEATKVIVLLHMLEYLNIVDAGTVDYIRKRFERAKYI